MGVENKKNSSLTVRITSKTKKDLKELAKNKGITISELINDLIMEQLEIENLKKNTKEQLEKRSESMEEKIKKLKEKMKW